MTGASVAILAILCCLIVVFLRSGHADYAVSVVPILLVPAAHLAGIPLTRLVLDFYPCRPFLVRVFTDVVGLAVACLLIAVFSRKIPTPKNKKLYLVLCTCYCVLLAFVYLYNLLP